VAQAAAAIAAHCGVVGAAGELMGNKAVGWQHKTRHSCQQDDRKGSLRWHWLYALLLLPCTCGYRHGMAQPVVAWQAKQSRANKALLMIHSFFHHPSLCHGVCSQISVA
jgi:hypothetical protein